MRSNEPVGPESRDVRREAERDEGSAAVSVSGVGKQLRSQDEATDGARGGPERTIAAPDHAEQWAMTPGLSAAMGLGSADSAASTDTPSAPHHVMPPPSWSTTVASPDARRVRSRDEASSQEPVAVQVAAGTGAAPQQTGEPRQAGAQQEEAASESGVVADIVGEPIIDSRDAVTPTIGYSGSITQGGVTLASGEFGRTDSSPTLKNVNITRGKSVFTVTATYELLTKWDTRKGTGPGGQKNIPDENAAALTKANYKTAVADLTPDMSDEGGRPPRSSFWAQDLTERHEQVHAREHQSTAKEGLKRALVWLSAQTANTKAEVEALLVTVQQKIVQYILANGAGSVGELHAYGDGAPLYLARATAIQKKGDKGGYP